MGSTYTLVNTEIQQVGGKIATLKKLLESYWVKDYDFTLIDSLDTKFPLFEHPFFRLVHK